MTEALALRALAIQLLADATTPVTDGNWARCVAVPPRTWRTFLAAERCAAALLDRLDMSGRLMELPADVREVIQGHSRLERARVLVARTQLRTIGQYSAAHDLRPVVLKGGVAVLEGRMPTDLYDIDLLLPDEHARALASWLDGDGWRTKFSSARHLKTRVRPGALPVDLHLALNPEGVALSHDTWDRVRPLAAVPGLWRLGPADDLWFDLVHATLDHPHRRGRLRDMLLIGDAERHCSEQDLREVERGIETHQAGHLLRAALDLARRVNGNGRAPDPFREIAFARYLLSPVVTSRIIPWTLSRYAAQGVLVGLLGGETGRARWSHISRRSLEVSGYRPVAWIERRNRRLGRAVRVALRFGLHTATLVMAWPVGRTLRHLYRRMDRSARARDSS